MTSLAISVPAGKPGPPIDRAIQHTLSDRPSPLNIRNLRERMAGVIVTVAAAVAVTMAIFSFTLRLNTANQSATGWVYHTMEVIDATNKVLLSADDAETGQRGFLLTADTAFLEPYHQSRHAIWQQYDIVRELTADNPRQQSNLLILQNLLRDKLMEIDRTMALAGSGDKAGALAVVATGEGKHLMDSIRRTIKDMIVEERSLLEVRRDGLQRLEARSELVLIALTTVSASGLLLVGFVSSWAIMTRAARKRIARQAADRQRLLDMVNVAAVMMRKVDGTIEFWSEGCHRLYGWTAEQAIGRLSHALLRTVSPVCLADLNATLLRTGSWNGELRHHRQDGVEVTVMASKTMHDYADGRGQLVVETLTDITELRRAEAELQESTAQFRSLVDTAADGFVIARSDGRILSVNQSILDLFGYERREALIGQNLSVLMPAAEAMRHDSYIAAHRQGGKPRVIGKPGRELLAVRQDGSEFPIDLSVSSFGANGEHHLTGIIRDATVRTQSETALRDSEARLRLVQQVGGIAYSDRHLPEPATLISEEFVRLYGLPPEQTHISTEQWADLLHPQDRARVTAERIGVLRRCGGHDSEFRIVRHDGTMRWVAMRTETFLGPNGKPDRVIGAQRDITDLVDARETLASRQLVLEQRVTERTAALAEAEAQFRGIFDSQFQFINLLDPDGIVLEANLTSLEAGGLTRDDVVGQPIWGTGWWPAAERTQLRAEIAQAARGASIRREVEINGANGRPIWIDFSLTPTRDPSTNAIRGIIAEGRDLTEKRDLSAQLVQAQKVQALGQLAGGIAHDFNNILQAVSGAAELIEQKPQDHDRTRRLARTAIAAANRGASITQRLLSFARRGDLRSVSIDAVGLLTNMREVLAHTLGSTITVGVNVVPSVPALTADQGQLETAIINLGTNARDAMPDGGALTLSAGADHVAEGDRHLAGLDAGDYVRLSVVDTGSGMDAATLARASEPFFTTKPQGQGTGLGVSMVKGFAEQSGGGLLITSTPGAGTTVTMWLPQAIGALADRIRDDERERSFTMQGSARVLLVDDDNLVLEILAASLEDAGIATLIASSGAEALALIEAGEVVDAMVSDLSMPGMNGVTTIQRARELRPALPCFLLTGYVGERAALSSGNDFTLVRKPVNGRTLVSQIEAVLEGAKRKPDGSAGAFLALSRRQPC